MARPLDDDTYIALALLGAGVISLALGSWWPILVVVTWAIGFLYMQGKLKG